MMSKKQKPAVVDNNKIFIQIAAYRDPQLLPTLKDCIDKARHPENLVFSIAWQHSTSDEWDTLYEFQDDPRFKIIDIDYRDARGPCWARHMLQQQYDGEKYTLQLDSHHRFVKNWDEECIKMFNQLIDMGHPKPLLTGYQCSYDPENDPDGRINVPWRMNFDRFIPEGTVFFVPASIDDYMDRTEPVPARFYSAHFAFTWGTFVKEVPHDPEFYFHGEECSISVRAFTWGYDLFHPHRVITWHEYTRNGKKKQWDDDPRWADKNKHAHKRNRQLFGMDADKTPIDFGPYGFGNVRTLEDYEKYSGISFKTRGAQQYTFDHNDPPVPVITDPEEYEKSFLVIFKHCVDLYAPSLIEPDYDFWVVSFEKLDGTVLHRRDADANEIKSLMEASKRNNNWITLWREYTGAKPDKWVVWPHSVSKGWCERIETILE